MVTGAGSAGALKPQNYKGYVDEKLTSEERLFDKDERQIFLGTEQWVASMRKIYVR